MFKSPHYPITDHSLCQLPNGLLLMPLGFPGGSPLGPTQVLVSHDYGYTWEHMPCIGLEEAFPSRFFLLNDATIMALLDYPRPQWASFAKFSDDGGAIFHTKTIVAQDGPAVTPDEALFRSRPLNFTEWDCARIDERELFAVVRSNARSGRYGYSTRSFDNGKTWELPQCLGFGADRPALLYDDGTLFLSHRDRNGKSTFLSVSEDGGQTWKERLALTPPLAQDSGKILRGGMIESGYGRIVKLDTGALAPFLVTTYAPRPGGQSEYPSPTGVCIYGQFFTKE